MFECKMDCPSKAGVKTPMEFGHGIWGAKLIVQTSHFSHGIRGTFTDPGIDWAELIGSVPFRQHVGSGMDPCAFLGVAPLGGQVEPRFVMFIPIWGRLPF